jgi:prepilin-type N-terminal cleavage/methylation domain-containing protein
MIRHSVKLSARSGMTLMELIVALVILAIAATAGEAAFTSLIDHRRAVREANVATERASSLREMIRGWLASGTVQIQRGGVPQFGRNSARITTPSVSSTAGINSTTNTAAQAYGDEVTFTTSAASPAMQANVRIRLYVDADPSTPEKGLSIEYQLSNASPLQRRMLDSSVDSLTVEFLDNRTSRWYESTQAATIQPRAVRIMLLGAGGKQLPKLLQLPIVLPIGNTANLTGQGLANQGVEQ